jgi:hypothetical protein
MSRTPIRRALRTADVYASYSDTLTGQFDGTTGPNARTVFVVVGLVPGKTALRVTTADADASKPAAT